MAWWLRYLISPDSFWKADGLSEFSRRYRLWVPRLSEHPFHRHARWLLAPRFCQESPRVTSHGLHEWNSLASPAPSSGPPPWPETRSWSRIEIESVSTFHSMIPWLDFMRTWSLHKAAVNMSITPWRLWHLVCRSLPRDPASEFHAKPSNPRQPNSRFNPQA